MTRRILISVLAALMISAVVVPVASAAPRQRTVDINQAVTGTLEDGTAFAGTLSVDNIRRVGDQLVADVTLTGNGIAPTAAAVPLQVVSCDILTLDIGAIFLDLLGLQLDIAPISIDLTAVPGPGNLLGNLLCAVAGLLDNLSLGDIIGRIVDGLLRIVNAILV